MAVNDVAILHMFRALLWMEGLGLVGNTLDST